MKFSVGDKMVIRRSGEEGYIVSLLDGQMAEVSVNGTIFPIYLDEIDHPYLRWFTQKNQEKKKVLREQIPAEPLREQPAKVVSGIHFTFLPEFRIVDMEERVVQLKLYLANETAHRIRVTYEVRTAAEHLFSYTGILQPFTDLYLHHLSWETMQEAPRFSWDISPDDAPQLAPYREQLKIRPVKLFEYINELLASNSPTFRITLLRGFDVLKATTPRPQRDRPVPQLTRALRSVQDIPRYELDLHIEQLMPDTKGLSNTEMLDIQLAELKRYLRIALTNRQDRMLIVHGLGKGVLRQEVHKLLKTTEWVDRIEDGWQAGYGFGATLVHFKYV
ncbi:MAG: Smr/MutS family protein [Chitinophagaceae bacterium]